MINEAIQNNEKLPGGYFKQLVEIEKTLKKVSCESIYDTTNPTNEIQWKTIIGSTPYYIDDDRIDYISEDKIYNVNEKIKTFSGLLFQYAKNVIETEEAHASSEAMAQLTKILNGVEIKSKMERIEEKIEQTEELLQDTRNEVEELRKQQTTLLGLLVKAEKPKKEEK